jgi:hypothetical protein
VGFGVLSSGKLCVEIFNERVTKFLPRAFRFANVQRTDLNLKADGREIILLGPECLELLQKNNNALPIRGNQ